MRLFKDSKKAKNNGYSNGGDRRYDDFHYRGHHPQQSSKPAHYDDRYFGRMPQPYGRNHQQPSRDEGSHWNNTFPHSSPFENNPSKKKMPPPSRPLPNDRYRPDPRAGRPPPPDAARRLVASSDNVRDQRRSQDFRNGHAGGGGGGGRDAWGSAYSGAGLSRASSFAQARPEPGSWGSQQRYASSTNVSSKYLPPADPKYDKMSHSRNPYAPPPQDLPVDQIFTVRKDRMPHRTLAEMVSFRVDHSS